MLDIPSDDFGPLLQEIRAVGELVEKVREAVEKKRRHEEKIVDARVREIASRRG